MLSTFKRFHLADFFALFICTVFAGTASGGIMNIVNGSVSPLYFAIFFHYPSVTPSFPTNPLFLESVQQGLLEGFVSGLILALGFTAFTFIASAASCSFRLSASYLPKMIAVAFFFWFIGGFNGVVAALLLPNFIRISSSQLVNCEYLWVGGSIYGAYFGGILSLVLGCAWFKRDWKAIRKIQQQSM